jgi:hypothetical protein
MANPVIKYHGVHIHKGVLKAGISVIPEEGDRSYAVQHVQIPVIPEGGYPGKLDKEGSPLDQRDYDNWLASLPKIWVTNPTFTHFIKVDPDWSKTRLEQEIQEIFTPDVLHSADAFLATRGRDERADFSRFRKMMAEKHRLGSGLVLPDDTDFNAIVAQKHDDFKDIQERLDSKGKILPYEGGTIDIGDAAIGRGSEGDIYTATYVNAGNPANGTGGLTSWEIYLARNFGSADIWIGTFSASGDVLTCRDSESIGDVASGSKQTGSGTDIDVEDGDYIGCYDKYSDSYSQIERDSSGYSGVWKYSGECIDASDSQTFSLLSGDAISLYCEGEEAPSGTTVTPSTLALTLTTYEPSIVIGTVLTPGTLALTTTLYAPTIAISENITVTPTTLALILTEYAPVLKEVTTPTTLALTLTTYAPTIEVSADLTVTPTTLALTITTYEPVLKEVLTPATLALALTTYEPVLDTGVIPSTLALTLAFYAPILKETITPATLALTLTTYSPILKETTTPTTASLTLTTYAPSIILGTVVTPSTLALVLTTYAPVLQEVTTPATLALTLTTYAPVLNTTVTPTTTSLTLATFAPVLALAVIPTTLALTLTGYAPILDFKVTPTTLALALTEYASSIIEGTVITPTTLALILTTFVPLIHIRGRALTVWVTTSQYRDVKSKTSLYRDVRAITY